VGISINNFAAQCGQKLSVVPSGLSSILGLIKAVCLAKVSHGVAILQYLLVFFMTEFLLGIASQVDTLV
jgi:hypothetical protein